jgi:hypothetical protein
LGNETGLDRLLFVKKDGTVMLLARLVDVCGVKGGIIWLLLLLLLLGNWLDMWALVMMGIEFSCLVVKAG